MIRLPRPVVAAALLLAFAASAVCAEPNAPVVPSEFEAIRAQQAQIRRDAMARTGPYADMSETTRRDLLQRQELVLRTIEGKQSAADLVERDRLAVFNALEWIEAAINQAEDDRLICEQRAAVGSNMKKRVCMTAGQAREARERARDELQRNERNMRL